MAQRRKFTPGFKAQVVLELISGTKSQAEGCRQYNLKPQLFSKWKSKFVEKAPVIFQTPRAPQRGTGSDRRVGADGRASDVGTRGGKKPQRC